MEQLTTKDDCAVERCLQLIRRWHRPDESIAGVVERFATVDGGIASRQLHVL
jgi:hypothetical protein